MDRGVSRALFFSSVVGPQDCSNVVLIELEQQLWTYASSLAKSQVPLNVELEVVGDKFRCEDDGVWREWLDGLRHCVDDWQWTMDEDLVQGSKSCGWESLHEMPLLVRMRRKGEEQKYEVSYGLGLIVPHGCEIPPLDRPIQLPVQRKGEILRDNSSA